MSAAADTHTIRNSDSVIHVSLGCLHILHATLHSSPVLLYRESCAAVMLIAGLCVHLPRLLDLLFKM